MAAISVLSCVAYGRSASPSVANCMQVKGSNWDEVKGQGVLECEPSAVVALFATNDVDIIRTYNPLYHSGYDIERFSETAKAAYGRVNSGDCQREKESGRWRYRGRRTRRG